MAKSQDTKKGSRKVDRNRKSAQNQRYLLERRHAKSHVKRLKVHLNRFSGDEVAQKALAKYQASA